MNYFVLNELTGEQVGPYDETQIRQMIARRKLKPKSLVRSLDSDWQRAGVLLKATFIAVQEQQKQEKQAAAEAKRESSSNVPDPGPAVAKPVSKARWSDPFDDASAESIQPAGPKIDSGPPRTRRRRSWTSQIFGATKPSPYWGFQFQGTLINIAIVIVMLISLVGMGVTVFVGVATIAAGETWVIKLTALGAMLASLFGTALVAILWIGVLVFYRNLIDWLIDMQDHAAAIRASLTGQPRRD